MQRRTFLTLAASTTLLTLLERLPTLAAPQPFNVYLTLDGGLSTKSDGTGPSVDILDVLLKNKAVATYFVQGRNIQDYEGPVLARILNEGHAVGNRLWQETGNTAADQSTPSLLAAQYLKAEKRIRSLLQNANPDAAKLYADQAKLYRRPGGDTALAEFLNTDNFDTLAREPYLKPYADVLDWLKSVYDYSGWHVSGIVSDKKTTLKSGYALMRRVMVGSKDEPGAGSYLCEATLKKQALQVSDGLIIQMADGDKLAPQALPQIILQLRARGAQFLTLPRANDKPNTYLQIGVADPPIPNAEGAVCS